jgi:acylphosphatase
MVMKKKRSLTFRGDVMDTLDWEKAEVFRLLKGQPGTQYQEADEADRKQIRGWVQNLLGNTIVTVQFVKSDGTVRDMRCTLDRSRIPPAPPKPVPTEIEASSTVNIDGLAESRKLRKEPDPVTQRVYDLDQNAWRSFRYDRLQKITAEISFAK